MRFSRAWPRLKSAEGSGEGGWRVPSQVSHVAARPCQLLEGGLSSSPCGLVSLSPFARMCIDFLKGDTETGDVWCFGWRNGMAVGQEWKSYFVLFTFWLFVFDCGKYIDGIQFTILTIFCVYFYVFKKVPSVEQPTPTSLPRTCFLLHKWNSTHSCSPAPGHHLSTFQSCEFGHCGTLYRWNHAVFAFLSLTSSSGHGVLRVPPYVAGEVVRWIMVYCVGHALFVPPPHDTCASPVCYCEEGCCPYGCQHLFEILVSANF